MLCHHMPRFSFLRGCLALAMVLVILTINLGSVQLRFFVEDFRETVSAEASLNATEPSQAGYRLNDFKPPKHSFIDYGSFFSGSIMPIRSSKATLLISYRVFLAIKDVYLELIVPPHPF